MKFVSPQLPNGGVFDVMAYGAKGDGTTDDTTAIGLCLAAAGTYAASNGGAIVNFPPAKYKWTSMKEVKSDVTIMAYGAYIFGNSTAGFLKNYSTTPAAGYTTGNQRITVLGGIWDGVGQSAAVDANYILFDFRNARAMTFRDATFRNVSSLNAIRLLAIDGGSIQTCRFEGYKDNSSAGESARGEMVCLSLDASGNCTKNVSVIQNAFGAATDGSALTAAFVAVGSHDDHATNAYTGIRVIGNQIDGNGLDTGEGILATGWSDSVITDNTLTNPGWHGVMLKTTNLATMKRIVVSANTIVDNRYKGVTIEPQESGTAEGISVNGNIVRSQASNGGPGISAWRTTASSIRGNHLYDGNNKGIQLATACADVLVTGNTITDAGTHGISLETATRCSVSGNRIYDAGQNGIYLTSGSSRNAIMGNQVMGYSRTSASGYAALAMDATDGQTDNVFIGNHTSATGSTANVGGEPFTKAGGTGTGTVVAFNSLDGFSSTHANNFDVTGAAVDTAISGAGTANSCRA